MSLELQEARRRTLVKSLVWRLIGIVWTWVGAYFIIFMASGREGQGLFGGHADCGLSSFNAHGDVLRI